MKKYYAISYPHGVAINGDTGDRYGYYHSFPSLSERNQWVEDGGDYRTGTDWREVIPASDAELRRAIKSGDITDVAWERGVYGAGEFKVPSDFNDPLPDLEKAIYDDN